MILASCISKVSPPEKKPSTPTPKPSPAPAPPPAPAPAPAQKVAPPAGSPFSLYNPCHCRLVKSQSCCCAVAHLLFGFSLWSYVSLGLHDVIRAHHA